MIYTRYGNEIEITDKIGDSIYWTRAYDGKSFFGNVADLVADGGIKEIEAAIQKISDKD